MTNIGQPKVTLLKHCASDLDVANAARVSFNKRSKELTKGDEGLINFLLREHHGTPFEHTYFQFHVEAPLFVFREWHRHRVGHSYNEMSARYTEMPEQCYTPATIRSQHGKPGAYTFRELDSAESFGARWKTYITQRRIRRSHARAFRLYRKLLKKGVAKEQARIVLPVATHSQMIWSCNARSLMHFLSLRTAPYAMKEIRVLAEQAEAHFASVMPLTYSAWVTNGRVAP